MSRKILVTGANGYLGKGVVKQLLDDGHDVIAADFKDDHIDRRAGVFCGDIFSMENPYDCLGKPEILFHLAWRDGFMHDSLNHMDDLPYHLKFINRMLKGGAGQVSVMGSMHEVGFYEGSINEYTPCRPQSLYGISKNALRSAVELQCRRDGAVFQWLRGFYIVGSTGDGSSVFSKIVQVAEKGQEVFPFTMGLNQFDFIDYDEFCRLAADVVGQDEINGIINICHGRPEKLADRTERFIRENGFDIRLDYGAFPDRPYDSKAVWGDDFKIRMIEKAKESVRK